jgi:hypothetical protein
MWEPIVRDQHGRAGMRCGSSLIDTDRTIHTQKRPHPQERPLAKVTL